MIIIKKITREHQIASGLKLVAKDTEALVVDPSAACYATIRSAPTITTHAEYPRENLYLTVKLFLHNVAPEDVEAMLTEALDIARRDTGVAPVDQLVFAIDESHRAADWDLFVQLYRAGEAEVNAGNVMELGVADFDVDELRRLVRRFGIGKMGGKGGWSWEGEGRSLCRRRRRNPGVRGVELGGGGDLACRASSSVPGSHNPRRRHPFAGGAPGGACADGQPDSHFEAPRRL